MDWTRKVNPVKGSQETMNNFKTTKGGRVWVRLARSQRSERLNVPGQLNIHRQRNRLTPPQQERTRRSGLKPLKRLVRMGHQDHRAEARC